MAITVGVQEVEKHLASYLERAAGTGERIRIEKAGRPLAALVSVDDLERLEAAGRGGVATDDRTALLERFRHDLAIGGAITFPSGPRVPSGERHRIRVEGSPISEQIIADRR